MGTGILDNEGNWFEEPTHTDGRWTEGTPEMGYGDDDGRHGTPDMGGAFPSVYEQPSYVPEERPEDNPIPPTLVYIPRDELDRLIDETLIRAPRQP